MTMTRSRAMSLLKRSGRGQKDIAALTRKLAQVVSLVVETSALAMFASKIKLMLLSLPSTGKENNE
jgi:hypothetical protein